ncbi:short-chain dehydrogenase [Enemella evansiae]|uniref:Short-chain dehydrogenase n=1 Tax=Enemella evansiae TaxID=2016499 RepID=A0A255GL67_9ACTN|nr:SDR family NAD(P)-dependent oxidoreductase [Enemella evansiae]OYO13910.1 short-chain dehydrogenase [Enemella evansiae]OYO16142.1 short-chain dehydrogenase [Enemella evansiae]
MTESGAPIALVAGASRGLGLLVARELGRRGYRVALCARNAEALQQAVRSLAEEGVDATAYPCDVSEVEAVRAMVRQIETELGPIETSIQVAGNIQVGPPEAVTHEHFVEAIDVMLWGPINVAMTVLPGMRERRSGHIGTVSSVGGMISVPHLLPYSTAKFGAYGFSQGLRAATSGTGVTVTTITPWLMRTGSHLRAQFFGDAAKEYAWFAPGASLPLVSVDGEVAARRIVDGTLAGKALVPISPLTRVAAAVQGLLPGTTATLLGLAGRLLPRGTNSETVDGEQARTGLRRGGLVDRLTTLGDRMARRTNEV